MTGESEENFVERGLGDADGRDRHGRLAQADQHVASHVCVIEGHLHPTRRGRQNRLTADHTTDDLARELVVGAERGLEGEAWSCRPIP